MAREDVAQTDPSQSFCDNWKWRLSSKGVWIGLEFLLLILVLLTTLSVDGFWRIRNLQTLAQTWLLYPALLVPPMILVIASGGVDLSVGAVAGVVSAVMASLLSSGTNPAVALLIGMLLAILIGLVNGLLVGLARVHAAVATLGMMTLLRGIAIAVTGGRGIPVGEVGFLGSLAVPGLLLALLLTIGIIALTELAPFARKRFLGLCDDQPWYQRLAFAGLPYVLSSAMAGFAGACYIGLVRFGAMTMGTGLEVDVMLIVFLGGTPLGGGLVNGVGAVLATLTFAVGKNVLTLSGLPSHERMEIVKGIGLLILGLLSHLYYVSVDWTFKRTKSGETPIVDSPE
jgi:ribose transport system permease protein